MSYCNIHGTFPEEIVSVLNLIFIKRDKILKSEVKTKVKKIQEPLTFIFKL